MEEYNAWISGTEDFWKQKEKVPTQLFEMDLESKREIIKGMIGRT